MHHRAELIAMVIVVKIGHAPRRAILFFWTWSQGLRTNSQVENIHWLVKTPSSGQCRRIENKPMRRKAQSAQRRRSFLC